MTKIDIISGFLGAGKTTFIKKLLEEAIAGEQVVLIENEFGQIGIDGGFLKNSGIEIREMNSGCICCSLVGDFGKSLEEVLTKYQPDRVIIEPSGVGKLSDVMKAVRDVASTLDVVLNSAVTIVDASKCKMYMKNFGEFFNNQIENAGTVVLSRTDVVDAAKVQQDVELIREHNASASIVTTPCSQLSGAQLLEIIEKPDTMAEDLMREVEERRAHEAEHDHEHHHHADEVFTSWGVESARKYTKEEITNALTALEDADKYGMILRAKGIVPAEDGSWIHFDYVPGTPDVRSGSAGTTGRLCVIGSGIHEDALTELFHAE